MWKPFTGKRKRSKSAKEPKMDRKSNCKNKDSTSWTQPKKATKSSQSESKFRPTLATKRKPFMRNSRKSLRLEYLYLFHIFIYLSLSLGLLCFILDFFNSFFSYFLFGLSSLESKSPLVQFLFTIFFEKFHWEFQLNRFACQIQKGSFEILIVNPFSQSFILGSSVLQSK